VRAISQIENALMQQRGHLFCWVPVCLGIGIGGYFSLQDEPHLLIFVATGLLLTLVAVAARLVHTAIAPLLIGLVLIGCGAGLAKFRTETVAGPVIGFRYYGPIEGRIVNIDRSGSDAVRLTLDRVVLNRMSRDRTPHKVRVSLHGAGPQGGHRPGDVVMTTGHLSPPASPAEPYGFDFQRHAWFMEIGAVGYSRNPVVRIAAPVRIDWRLWVFQQRRALSDAVQREIEGEAGAFAAAIMAGDRSALSQATIANLRATNLAHLLAISGLHMGLLVGFIFAIVRSVFALAPPVALRLPSKKIAAVCALLVGGAYLALSGGNVATQRAYIMVAVMLVAVMLDRKALTLRAVAIAATIVLLLQPEALVGPGFQMSFAATTALILVFRNLRNIDMQRLPNWLKPPLSVVLSSAVAGIATAPFAAAHFNQIAHYGLLANVLSVPLMGLIVVPAAVLAICLSPFGLWGICLSIAAAGLKWILFVSNEVSQIEGGLGHVVAPAWYMLPVMALGLLFLALTQGRIRWLGVPITAMAFGLWGQTQRPEILVADSGSLMGIMGTDGRALSKAKGNSFVARIWLENDGTPVDQALAAKRRGFSRQERRVRGTLQGWDILLVTGKTALAAVRGCDGADILITNQILDDPRPCTTFDPKILRKTGALGITAGPNGDLFITPARYVAGSRPWNQGGVDAPIILSRNHE